MVTAIRNTSAWPLATQFACTIVIIISGFLAQFPLDAKGFGHPFALFLACVFMVSLMFGRPSGILAVALSTALSTAFFAPVSSIHLMRAFEFFQIELYAALAVGATIMADQIHRTLIALADTNIQLTNEDTKKTLQLREVVHRVANNFTSLDLLIRQRARASKDPKIKFAFEQASELVHVVARLNNRLNVAAGDSTLDSQVFVSDLCEDLKACARNGIAIECHAESHDIALTAAVPLGLIINELVTNALKYAFPDQRQGLVRVAFLREDDHYHLLVEDNGVGMSGSVKGNGLGLHLLQGFSRAIKGEIDIRSTFEGTSASLKFEATPEKTHQDDFRASSTMIH
jgi:two-component sensor histidine kinase